MMKTLSPQGWGSVRKHRQLLYGFAALAIMVLHMDATFDASGLPRGVINVMFWIKRFGECGVEIFLLLSGFGLYQSLRNNPRIRHFYARRVMRVFVPAFIVGAIYFGLTERKLLNYLISISFLPCAFWKGTFWFIAFILFMYMIYPLIYRLQCKRPRALWILIGVFLAFTFAMEYLSPIEEGAFYRAVSRIPAFLLGCALAPRICDDAPVPRWLLPASAASSAAWMAIMVAIGDRERFYAMRAPAFILLSIVLILLLTRAAEFLSRRGALARFIYRFLALCGGVSLEIYLLYDRLRELFGAVGSCQDPVWGAVRLDLATAVATILLSLLLRRLSDMLIRSFQEVRIPEPEGAQR